MKEQDNHPLSFTNMLAGILITVIGGLILAFILQGFTASPEEPVITSPPVKPEPLVITPSPTWTSAPKATNTPRPVSIRQANTPDPSSDLETYWQLVSKHNYEQAWNYLSADFRRNKHNNSFQDYASGWNHQSISIESLTVVYRGTSSAIVKARLRFYSGNGSAVVVLTHDLVYDASKNRWLIERAYQTE